MGEEAVQGTHVCEALPQHHLKMGPVPGAKLDCGTLSVYVNTLQRPLCMYNTTSMHTTFDTTAKLVTHMLTAHVIRPDWYR